MRSSMPSRRAVRRSLRSGQAKRADRNQTPQRFLADWEVKQGEPEIPEMMPHTGKKVAVVGGGPACLAVAGDLVRMGHKITVFEALHKLGGVPVYGIPEFRLPKAIVSREVEYLQRLGVEMLTDFVVGKTGTMESILGEYDSVFVGTGAGLPWFMKIPGENLNGVYSANKYPSRMNLMKGFLFPTFSTPIKHHKKVAVVGGGNVAMDSAENSPAPGGGSDNHLQEVPGKSPHIRKRLKTPRKKASSSIFSPCRFDTTAMKTDG